MEYLILSSVLALITYFAIIKKRVPAEKQLNFIHQASQENESRNFLKEASEWLKTPKPLEDMLMENKPLVISRLIHFLHGGSVMERKYAAFSLGQIGDVAQVNELQNALSQETVRGVREAIAAALTALVFARDANGSTEEGRRKAIQEAYDGKRST
jgi:hypothetical protein